LSLLDIVQYLCLVKTIEVFCVLVFTGLLSDFCQVKDVRCQHTLSSRDVDAKASTWLENLLHCTSRQAVSFLWTIVTFRQIIQDTLRISLVLLLLFIVLLIDLGAHRWKVCDLSRAFWPIERQLWVELTRNK